MTNLDAHTLAQAIARKAQGLPEMTLMEVCGTHTHAIFRYGIRQLLPKNVRLISGPGCPVCVTDNADLARALWLAAQKDVVFCCFGDMLRVPCGKESLLSLRAAGADVRICVSPMDALALAKELPRKRIVWFGVGFETTAPHTAALIEAAERGGVPNISVYSVHKTMPQALRALMSGQNRISALLCPGHVAAITGAEAFRFVPNELHMPAAVAGFEAEDILAAVLALVTMLRGGTPSLVNAYPRAVKSEGNKTALALTEKIFEPEDALWRGLGLIPGSGLKIRKEYEAFDATKRFKIEETAVPAAAGCRCGEILRGLAEPTDCPYFAKTCTPQSPLGACMVSAEGACAAYYKYGGTI